MKKLLSLSILGILSLFLSLPSYAYTDAEVDNKVEQLKTIINMIFSKPENKEKYQYTFKNIFTSCSKTCKNELSKSASAKLLETYDEDFLGTKKENTNLIKYTFDSVIDGDTIKVIDKKGVTQSVRMIGLDSPESYATRFGYTECYGKEAKAALESIFRNMSSKDVYLEFDSTQGELDKYGRLLAYVYDDKKVSNINLVMIKTGYGWEYTYNLPYKYQTKFKEAMDYAEKNNLGLWAENACNGERTATEEIDTTSTTKPSNICLNHTWVTGPRGGCYYINETGEKTYGDHACCGN